MTTDSNVPLETSQIRSAVERAVKTTPVYDVHTHLYSPAFGELLLWGIDELLIYHYLVAESFRQFDLGYDEFWKLSKPQQADLIWDALFIQNSPISESCRGVVTTLNRLGLDVSKRDLSSIRKWYAEQDPDEFVSRCMETAGLSAICMTNSPFDALERPVWENGFSGDSRFTSALRIDPLLLDWVSAGKQLQGWGYDVSSGMGEKTFSEVRRFLADWSKKMKSQFAMVSLPPSFEFPSNSDCAALIEHAVLPHCREFGMPFALMPGVKRAVNPQLQLAGDGLGLSNLVFIQNLCDQFPENRFAVTVLSRENQHELCVLARKFRNLHVFGCWWFTNIPSLIEEMTRMRVELLGLSFTPQHSDARVMDQVVYKWHHSRGVIANVLSEKYVELSNSGWRATEVEIERDVASLFGGAFKKFCGN